MLYRSKWIPSILCGFCTLELFAAQGVKRPSDCVSLDWTLVDHGKSMYAEIIQKRKIPLLSKEEAKPGVLAITFDQGLAIMEELAPQTQPWEEVTHQVIEEGIEKLIYFLEVTSGMYLNVKDHPDFAALRTFQLSRPVDLNSGSVEWMQNLQSRRKEKNWFNPFVDEFLEIHFLIQQKIWTKYFLKQNGQNKNFKEIFSQRSLMKEIQVALDRLKKFGESYEIVMLKRGMDTPIFVSRKRKMPYNTLNKYYHISSQKQEGSH